MRTVPLGGKVANGRVALVDDEDYDAVMQYRWHASGKGRTTYAMTNVRRSGRRTTMEMHVLIMGAPGVDHVNHDGLDNQRHNLRFADAFEQARNQRRHLTARPMSRFKGVTTSTWRNGNVRYIASIRRDGRQTYLGCFEHEEDAARAYDQAARQAHGQFACVNFPEDDTPPPPPLKRADAPMDVILRLRAEGWGFPAIGREIGRSECYVRKHYFAETGEAVRVLPVVSNEEIVRLRRAGLTFGQIGKRVGLGDDSVARRYYIASGEPPPRKPRRSRVA